MKVWDKCPLKRLNTFGIDVYAAKLIEFDSQEELVQALESCTDTPFVMGGGSNLLYMGNFMGTILKPAIKSIDVISEDADSVLVKVGAGVAWDSFVAWTVKNGLWGAENLSSIPGQVGASAVQNIGAYGVEVKDIIESVQAVSIKEHSERIFTNAECGYSYRNSIFKTTLKGEYVVSYVMYRLSRIPAPKLDYGALRQKVDGLGEASLQNIRLAVAQIRAEKLPNPAVQGNAGSFFMNPVIPVEQFEKIKERFPDIPSYPAGLGKTKIAAGWLIEKSGWKGKAYGNAAVHDKQALVLVNTGSATGHDIKRLADRIMLSVNEKFGIHLTPEVLYI